MHTAGSRAAESPRRIERNRCGAPREVKTEIRDPRHYSHEHPDYPTNSILCDQQAYFFNRHSIHTGRLMPSNDDHQMRSRCCGSRPRHLRCMQLPLPNCCPVLERDDRQYPVKLCAGKNHCQTQTDSNPSTAISIPSSEGRSHTMR
jgi:hypothetical protein